MIPEWIIKCEYESLPNLNNHCRYFDLDYKLHNPNGPAVSLSAGYLEWYIHGKLHRIDGPARKVRSFVEYYIDDVQFTDMKKYHWVAKNYDKVTACFDENTIAFTDKKVEAEFKLRFG